MDTKCVILILKKYDGLAYYTSKYENKLFSNVYRNKKYKTKLRTMLRIAFTSSCLVLFKEFGPSCHLDAICKFGTHARITLCQCELLHNYQLVETIKCVFATPTIAKGLH